MSWPFTRPFAEAELYKQRLDDALESASNGFKPIFAMMRHAAVYTNKEEASVYIKAIQRILGQFENLYRNLGDVKDGFPKEIALKELENREEYNPKMLEENLMFGTPNEVIKKLKLYEHL